EKRERVINAMTEIGGQGVEPASTQGISSTQLNQSLREIGFTPEIRMKRLRRLLEAKPIIRILEAHNGLTGNIIENTKIEEDHMIKEFDGSWISSLTDSLSKGKPDTEIVDFTSRLNTINQVLETTTKPIIVDGDTGGLTEHFVSMVKTLERLGVSAIIVEDKVGSKKNSLFGTEANQEQDTIDNFAYKIREGKKAQITQDFMIIARIESLILKKGMWDALLRARAYIESGADAIMIHSKEKDFKEIADFCKEYKKFERKVPLVAVPSTYSHVTEKELAENGINIVIYANHLLRAAYPAMLNTAKSILLNERAYEMEDNLFKINELIKLIEK
ncbi:MAG: phosphoenolpyruvate mutase, partial [Nanoarchaeota archaeon]